MTKILNKEIKVNIPFVSIQGSAKLSKIIEMNAIQSRIALLIVSHKELGISKKTLGEAIEEVYGLIPNNQPVILKDIKEMVKTKTLNIDLSNKSILEQKVMILDLKMNKGIKGDIISKEKYSLMTSKTRSVNKKLAVELFDGLGIIENPTFEKQEDLKISNKKIYSESQFKDLIEAHIKVEKNETLDEVTLSSKEGTIAWIPMNLKIEISKEIKALDNESEKIIKLLIDNNIDINPAHLINNNVTKLKLNATTKDFKTVDSLDENKLMEANNVIDTKYTVGKYGITKFYERSFKSLLNKREIDIKEIVSTDETFENLFKTKSSAFNEEILRSFPLEGRIEFIKVIGNGVKVTEGLKNILLDDLSTKLFRELSVESLKKIISSKELFNKYFENSISKFKFEPSLIQKLNHLGYVKEEWLLKHTSYQYMKERLFEKWKPETKFFEALKITRKISLENMTKDEIKTIIDEFQSNVPKEFANQKLYKELLIKLNKARSLAGEWNSDRILAEGIRLRSKLEDFALNNYEGEKKLDNKQLMDLTFKQKYSKKMYESYKELSNIIGHNVAGSSNLEKEEVVKNNLSILNKFFDMDIKELKLVKKKIKKEGK